MCSSKEKSTKSTLQFLTLIQTRTLKFIKEVLLQPELHIDPHRLIVGDFNIPFLTTERSSRQKLIREMLELTAVINQMDLMVLIDHFTQTQKTALSSQHPH